MDLRRPNLRLPGLGLPLPRAPAAPAVNTARPPSKPALSASSALRHPDERRR